MKRAFAISGFFTEDEVAELMQTIRRIEQRHPDELYQVTGINREEVDGDIMKSAEYLERVFPRLPGEDPIVGVVERHKNNE